MLAENVIQNFISELSIISNIGIDFEIRPKMQKRKEINRINHLQKT